MVPTIIASLVLALVTGLTFVAYKHPRGYRRLCIPLMGLALVVFVVWAAYDVGFANGFSGAVRELNKDKAVLTPSLHEIMSVWVILLPLLSVLYLGFLTYLPSILDLKGNADEP